MNERDFLKFINERDFLGVPGLHLLCGGFLLRNVICGRVGNSWAYSEPGSELSRLGPTFRSGYAAGRMSRTLLAVSSLCLAAVAVDAPLMAASHPRNNERNALLGAKLVTRCGAPSVRAIILIELFPSRFHLRSGLLELLDRRAIELIQGRIILALGNVAAGGLCKRYFFHLAALCRRNSDLHYRILKS